MNKMEQTLLPYDIIPNPSIAKNSWFSRHPMVKWGHVRGQLIWERETDVKKPSSPVTLEGLTNLRGCLPDSHSRTDHGSAIIGRRKPSRIFCQRIPCRRTRFPGCHERNRARR